MAVATSPERATMAPASSPAQPPMVSDPARAPEFERQPRGASEAPGARGPRWSLPKTATLAGVIILVSLLMVVAASAYLTQGQVTLTRMQGQLNAVLDQHHLLEDQVAALSNPSKVVSRSQDQGLVAPTNVTDLNQVNPSEPSTTTPAAGHASVTAPSGP